MLIVVIGLIIVTIMLLIMLGNRRKKVILQVGPSLKDKGGMVTVMTGILYSDLTKNYNIIHVPTYIVGKKVSLFILAIFKILIYKTIYKVQLVHVHSASYGSFYRKSIIIRLCKLLNIKVILHTHGAGFKDFYGSLSGPKKKYVQKTLKMPYKIIVLSNSWKEFYGTLTNKNKIDIVYNSVEVPEYVQRNNNTNVTGLFLGRIGKRKGIYDLIESIKKLKQQELNFKILVAGDGEIEEAKKVVEQEKLNNYIEILGWIDKEQATNYLKECDFYILPSYNEGLPMSVLEAMSYSLPVITTNVGGIPEVVLNNENGILIEPGNIEQLANAINSIVKNAELRNKLGEQAHKTIEENFNIKNFIEKINQMYRQVKNEKTRLCLASSAGGHFMQLKQLFKIAEQYNWFLVTEKNESSKDLKNKYRTIYLVQQERKKADIIVKLAINIIKSFFIVLIKRPEVIVSTGAGATYFLCLFTKTFGGKVIFIESFAKIKTPTITGQKVYKFADMFYVQWEEMLQYYPKAQYKGGIY